MEFLKFVFYFWGLINFFYAISRFVFSNKKLDTAFSIYKKHTEMGSSLKTTDLSKSEQLFAGLNFIYFVSFLVWSIIGAFFSPLSWFGFVFAFVVLNISNFLLNILKNIKILYTIQYTIHWLGHLVFSGFMIINAYHLHLNLFELFF